MYTLASLTTFVTAYSQSDFFGKLIFLGLIASSIICWVVLIHKVRMINKVKKISSAFQHAFEKNKERILSLELADLPKAPTSATPHPFAQVFRALKEKTLEILNKNHFFHASKKETSSPSVYLSASDLELVESYAFTTISAQTKLIEKNIFILSTIVTLAPFLGLLGTVWGILLTFAGLQGGAAGGSNAAIIGGLSTALATTVLGLVIAIPALIAYNYLRQTTKTLSSDMEDFLYLLLSTVELQYRKADI